MIDEKSKHLSRLVFVLDGLVVVLSYIWAVHAHAMFLPDKEIDTLLHLALLPLILPSLGLGFSYWGAYRQLRTSLVNYAWIVARAYILTLALLIMILFFLGEHGISRIVITVFTVLSVTLLILMRATLTWWYFKRLKIKDESRMKVLVVGTGERAVRVTELLRKNADWGVDVVGYLDTDAGMVGTELCGSKVIGTVNEISNILKWHVVDEVVLAVPRSMIEDVGSIVDACSEEGVRLRLMADLFDFQVARMRLDVLGGVPLLNFEPVAQHEAELFLKRLIDIVLTAAAMPILLPILVAIAIAVKLDSPGPVFFVQQRVGYRKRVFPMYKFRSMVVGSEQKLKEIEHLNEASGPIFKIANDPRVTRVGKFLRKTSLDELPQLFNVLLGHMSLVGPRPMSIRDVNLFDRGIQRKRFSVKPGLTCLWQISGRSSLPFEKWLELDLAYIENWSLKLDMKILFKTVPVVLKGEGAV
ncbi:MAG: sugar transferase [Pseudomonadota bacterium]